MVVLHHAGSLAGPDRAGGLNPLLAVGDGGVAVFFVLSGFLIYRPFVVAHLEGRSPVPWRVFWWRRALRIIPAYWLALTFFWLIGNFDLGSRWWRHYLFLQVYDRSTIMGGIVQAWSLCVEMSFYLFVPLWGSLLLRLGRRSDGRGVALVHLVGCGLLWCAGFVFRWGIGAWAPGQRGLSFNWLPANIDLFATGMALAVASVLGQRSQRLTAWAGRVAPVAWPYWSAGVALFAWYAYAVGPADFATGYEGWFWHRRQIVLGLISVLLMLPAVFGPLHRGRLRAVWSWRPVVWVGTVSYGLYLWHLDWMERALGQLDPQAISTVWSGWVTGVPGHAPLGWMVAVGMGLGLASAAVSWYGLERPLQRFRGLVRRPG